MDEYLLKSKRRTTSGAAVCSINGKFYRLPFGRPTPLPERVVEVLRGAGLKPETFAIDRPPRALESPPSPVRRLRGRRVVSGGGGPNVG